MEVSEFTKSLIGLGEGFVIEKISMDELKREISVHIRYASPHYEYESVVHKLYDLSSERRWQHPNWFECSCYIVCKLPHYIAGHGTVKMIEAGFTSRSKGYTYRFAAQVTEHLQLVKVQRTVARPLNTSSHTVRSIMSDTVSEALESKGVVTDLRHVAMGEKAYRPGHEYATIATDKDGGQVLNMVEGRKERSVKMLFLELNEQGWQPQGRGRGHGHVEEAAPSFLKVALEHRQWALVRGRPHCNLVCFSLRYVILTAWENFCLMSRTDSYLIFNYLTVIDT